MPHEKKYVAYMLRLWQGNAAHPSAWQASLEDPHSGKQIGFADLSSLFSFLEDQTGKDPVPTEIPERENKYEPSH